MKTRCYINRYATHEMLGDDLKALIPNVALRRRMSRFVRWGWPPRCSVSPPGCRQTG